jgi:acyl carrier protein
MTSESTATQGMPVSPAGIEQIIIDVLFAASPGKSIPVSRDTQVLDIVDSLGLMMSLATVQATLKITLEPKEIIAALQARSVADLASVLMAAMGVRCALPA